MVCVQVMLIKDIIDISACLDIRNSFACCNILLGGFSKLGSDIGLVMGAGVCYACLLLALGLPLSAANFLWVIHILSTLILSLQAGAF